MKGVFVKWYVYLTTSILALFAYLSGANMAMLGDSLIAQMASAQSTMPNPFAGAVNLGIGGQTITQIAARVGSIPTSATRILLEGGVNDLVLLGTDAAIIPAYTAMLNAIPSTQRVILLGLPQVDEALSIANFGNVLNNAKINAVNSQLIKLCESYPNCVPATAFMTMNRNGKTVDGVHFTAASYQEFAAAVRPYI